MKCKTREAVVAVVKANFPEPLKRDKAVHHTGLRRYRGYHGTVTWFDNIVVMDKNGKKIYITLQTGR